MAYSFTLWLFSVALLVAFGCQVTHSTRPTNPESDPDCIRVESVKKDNRDTWDSGDRIFICPIDKYRHQIYSYHKNEVIVVFTVKHNIVIEEQWALSIRFTVISPFSTSIFQCAFPHIGYARAFYDLVNPRSRFSPQDFTLRGLDLLKDERGKSLYRKTLSTNPLIFHQHFVDAFITKFTFEPADESEAGWPLLQFSMGQFQIVEFRPYTEIMLANNRDNELWYYILNFGDSEKSGEFANYMNSFVESGSQYTFPDGYDG